MRMLITIIAVFTINAVFGSFCMMSMAMAADLQMDGNRAEAMDQISHVDCADCSSHEAPTPQSSGCAGHCLSQMKVSNQSNTISICSPIVAAVPLADADLWIVNSPTLPKPSATISPPYIPADTIVLTL